MTSTDNPWLVDSIQDFWFLKCPECNFDTKEEYIFQHHAIQNHPQSLPLFSNTIKQEAFEGDYEIQGEVWLDTIG